MLDSRPVSRALAVVLTLCVCCLALLLTLALVRVLQSNQNTTGGYAAQNRALMTAYAEESRTMVAASQQVIADLVKQQRELVQQQSRQVELIQALVELQNRVTGFSDEQIRARRAQGQRERYRSELCKAGQLRGKDCENLPDPATFEMLDR